jgi:hypothetical protein
MGRGRHADCRTDAWNVERRWSRIGKRSCPTDSMCSTQTMTMAVPLATVAVLSCDGQGPPPTRARQ